MMSAKRLITSLVLGAQLSLGAISPAIAYDWDVIGVHITVVEGTYMPGAISFQTDVAVGTTCPAGSWLIWNGLGPDAQTQQANAKSVYALLLAAKLSGKTVNLFGNNKAPVGPPTNANTCLVTFVHLQ
jgi:hypothetical protein